MFLPLQLSLSTDIRVHFLVRKSFFIPIGFFFKKKEIKKKRKKLKSVYYKYPNFKLFI